LFELFEEYKAAGETDYFLGRFWRFVWSVGGGICFDEVDSNSRQHSHSFASEASIRSPQAHAKTSRESRLAAKPRVKILGNINKTPPHEELYLILQRE